MRTLIAFVLSAACTVASAASFVGLLKGGPAELFDDVDLHLFLDAARKALDDGRSTSPSTGRTPRPPTRAT